MAALPTFMLAMLLSGALNTLFMKFMVMQEVPVGTGRPSTGFDHPFFQTLLMMVGECLCLLVYFGSTTKAQRDQAVPVPNRVFVTACSLDWTATTLVNMAYVFIAASVVQMTRGAVVIFTCLFSVVFLGRKQHAYHLAGVALVAAGITLVSLSALLAAPTSTVHPVSPWLRTLGIVLCVSAQIFQASMLVYEEKILSHYSVAPMRVVGMEGACGIFLGVILLLGLNAANIESTSEAVYQMRHSTPLQYAIIGSIFSIAIFNFSGVTVTQQASAVARSTIDVSRTILIWMVEISFGWNSFSWLQLAGFVLVAAGTLLYNRLIVVPSLEPQMEEKALMPEKLKEQLSTNQLSQEASYTKDMEQGPL